MSNNYKRKTNQGAWDESMMAEAIKDVQKKHCSVKVVAVKYGILRTTLRRHLKKGCAKKKLGRFTTVFTPQQKTELLEYVLHMNDLFFGITKEDFLQLVFQYAEKTTFHTLSRIKQLDTTFIKGLPCEILT